MKRLFLTGLITFLFLSIFAPLASADFIVPPQPQTYVLDEATILSDSTEAALNTQLATLDKETGTQMVVVTLTNLQGYEPEQAALAIGRTWQVGQKDTDNGLIFLIAPTQRAARIEVGYGLEGAITDAQSYQILETLSLPLFAQGDYDTGTLQAISALQTLARGEPFPLPDRSPTVNPEVWFYALFFLIPFFRLLSNSKSWWLGGVIGAVAGIFIYNWIGLLLGLLAGLSLDFVLSRYFFQKLGRSSGGFWFGGPRGPGGSGGFGGFSGGGGSFGGGGASGRW